MLFLCGLVLGLGLGVKSLLGVLASDLNDAVLCVVCALSLMLQLLDWRFCVE